MTKNQLEYRAYLQSGHWLGLRTVALKRDNYHCQFCGNIYRLQVHHMKYRERWEDTKIEDLLTLCYRCHKTYHARHPDKLPIHKRKRKPSKGAMLMAQAMRETRDYKRSRCT